MAWIDQIDIGDAAGELAEIYARLAARSGGLDLVSCAQSLNPEALRCHLQLYEQLQYGDSSLTRADREAIAVVVSATNNSPYCVDRHAEALAEYDSDNTRLKQIMSGLRFLEMPDRSAKMLSYSAKVTARPASIGNNDIEELRAVGFSDRDILDINLVAAYFNFLNRVALGLGVKL